MGSFQQFFEKSSQAPALYRGRMIMIGDTLEVAQEGESFCITVEFFAGEAQQGIILDTEGLFYIDNQEVSKRVILWQDSYPLEKNIFVKSKSGKLMIWNAWNFRKSTESFLPLVHYGHNGAAMIVEELPNGRRYYCNDWEPDDDFNDLIFRIERITHATPSVPPPPSLHENLFPEPPMDEFVDPLLRLSVDDSRRLVGILDRFEQDQIGTLDFRDLLLKYGEHFQRLLQGQKHEQVDMYQWLTTKIYQESNIVMVRPIKKAIKEFIKRWRTEHPNNGK